MDMNINEMFMAIFLLLVSSVTVQGHGGMVEPPMRSIMWRYGFDSPVNYDWNALFCGGRENFIKHKGRCGVCGDPVQGPYENDKGGIYDNGIIVRHYPAGLTDINVKVEITAHHKGYFQFKLCPNNDGPLTQECLDRHPLPIREGLGQGNPLRYYPPVTPKLNELHVALPPDVVCDRCVLQWTYTAGNSLGTTGTGQSCVGCGYQETFVNCADISIGGSKDRIPVHKEPVQDGGVVEIGEETKITAALDNAKPDANVADILREFGLVFPGDPKQLDNDSPVVNPTVVVNSDIPRVVSPRLVHSQPKVVKPVSSAVGTSQHDSPSVKPHLPQIHIHNTEGSMLPARRPIPPPSQAEMQQSGWDITGSLRSNFHPSPHHNMLIDTPMSSPDMSDGFDAAVAEFERRRQQDIAEAFARRPTVPDARILPSIPGGDGRKTYVHGRTNEQPLLDAVYALRDRVPKDYRGRISNVSPGHVPVVDRERIPNFHHESIPAVDRERIPNLYRERMPEVDIYGNYRKLTPFGVSSSTDPFQRQRQLSKHYLEKVNKLGNDVHNSLRDFHSDRYRDVVRSGVFSKRVRAKPLLIRRRVFRLPRRVMVHSIALAKRLVRRFPMLRGRVFLSRMAHLKNKYANMAHKYARRIPHVHVHVRRRQ